ncbi:MAG: hypothetical protein KA259_02275 [Caldilineaceae bacterium]|nr:hypothetical protein [Caldilineaceae bacterium]MBP8291315.1 hypothetical protein [Caldilineaceae bacterium]
MRQNSHWIVLAISALILVTSVGLTLFGAPAPSLAAGEARPVAVEPTASGGPQGCRECHLEEYDNWVHSAHAQASFDPIFQVYLQAERQPGECFACHSTGYDTATGSFVLSGVSCEACHGPYRSEHPAKSMEIARSAEMCGACHQSTHAEWEVSRHGQAGVNCIDCHEVHSQQTHATASTNALCADCHREQVDNFVHRQHDAEDVACIDCHLSRPEGPQADTAAGEAMTAHSFSAEAVGCSHCHAPLENQP